MSSFLLKLIRQCWIAGFSPFAIRTTAILSWFLYAFSSILRYFENLGDRFASYNIFPMAFLNMILYIIVSPNTPFCIDTLPFPQLFLGVVLAILNFYTSRSNSFSKGLCWAVLSSSCSDGGSSGAFTPPSEFSPSSSWGLSLFYSSGFLENMLFLGSPNSEFLALNKLPPAGGFEEKSDDCWPLFEKRPPPLVAPNKDFGYSPSLAGANKLPLVNPPNRPLFVFYALTPPKIDGFSSFELVEEKLNKLAFGGFVVVFPNKLVPAGKVVVNLKPVAGF